MLTDRFPYSYPDDGDKFLVSRFDRKLVPANKYNARVDPLLDKILYKSLSIDPKERYQTASELLNDLEKWENSPGQINGLE